MKVLISFYLIMIMATSNAQQVQSIDLNKYCGKWYVIAVIPTRFDKDWEYVTETYTLKEKSKIGIYTTYVKKGKTETQFVNSKGFPCKDKNNVAWKVQFVWPFKADYLIEELDQDYTYTVVGHPKKKFLYIMNRTGKMDVALYNEIVKCLAEKGYDMTKLRKVLQ